MSAQPATRGGGGGGLGGVCVCSDDGRMGRGFYVWYFVSGRDECESLRYGLVVRHGEEYGYVECRYME